MNSPMKQKTDSHREQTGGYQGERGEPVTSGHTLLYRMDKNARPHCTVQELDSTFYNKPQWKEYEKECVCVWSVYIYTLHMYV